MCYVCAVYVTKFLGAQLLVSHACEDFANRQQSPSSTPE